MLRFLNLFAILIAIILINETLGCEKVPPIRHGRKSRGDNGYRLFLGDEPKGYEPGKIYNREFQSNFFFFFFKIIFFFF